MALLENVLFMWEVILYNHVLDILIQIAKKTLTLCEARVALCNIITETCLQKLLCFYMLPIVQSKVFELLKNNNNYSKMNNFLFV